LNIIQQHYFDYIKRNIVNYFKQYNNNNHLVEIEIEDKFDVDFIVVVVVVLFETIFVLF
jgi:hypothetical protein